jgi:hypothetical protein
MNRRGARSIVVPFFDVFFSNHDNHLLFPLFESALQHDRRKKDRQPPNGREILLRVQVDVGMWYYRDTRIIHHVQEFTWLARSDSARCPKRAGANENQIEDGPYRSYNHAPVVPSSFHPSKLTSCRFPLSIYGTALHPNSVYIKPGYSLPVNPQLGLGAADCSLHHHG